MEYWQEFEAPGAAPRAAEALAPMPDGSALPEALGHANWVAPGYTRKLCCEARLSVPLLALRAASTARMARTMPR